MPDPRAVEAAREFWRLMATNDFSSVAAVLAPDVEFWPEPYAAPGNRAHLVKTMD